MKLKLNLTSIGAAVVCVLTIVAIILFSAAYNSCYGYFEMQYPSLPYVIAFGIITILLSVAVIVLPMLELEGTAKKAVSVVVDVCVVAVCVFACITGVYAAKASVYEMALTWASELHSNEPYMIAACQNALISIILSVVGMLVMGVTACISLKVAGKKG